MCGKTLVVTIWTKSSTVQYYLCPQGGKVINLSCYAGAVVVLLTMVSLLSTWYDYPNKIVLL